MNTACPTDERLKSLIMEAFDESIMPDPARLQHIESRLTNKLSRNKGRIKAGIPHWLIWLFLAASASATAWWSSEYFLANEELDAKISTPPLINEPAASIHTNPPVATDKEITKPKQYADKPESSLIYQREQY